MFDAIPGEKLQVPVLRDSHLSYELSVKRTIQLDGSEIYVCGIANILADEALADASRSVHERLLDISPVCTTFTEYFDFSGAHIGAWGDWKDGQK